MPIGGFLVSFRHRQDIPIFVEITDETDTGRAPFVIKSIGNYHTGMTRQIRS